MGITYGDHLIDTGHREYTEEEERRIVDRGFTTHNSGTPQRRPDDMILLEALGILHRFALEQTGWRSWIKRWYYSDEPLRHDAANLVRRAGYLEKRPEHTELVGS